MWSENDVLSLNLLSSRIVKIVSGEPNANDAKETKLPNVKVLIGTRMSET